jgi:5'(3')-deoxyribonucleotidase
MDVDGVLADLHTEWLRRYNADYGDTMTRDDVTRWGIETLVKPACGKRIYDYLSQPDLYEYVAEIPGAYNAVQAMRARGDRVVYVTSNMKGMTDQKWLWLERHGYLADARDLVVATDKSLVLVDALVDDALINVRAFRRGGGVLVNAPWNRGEPWWLRAYNWSQVLEMTA